MGAGLYSNAGASAKSIKSNFGLTEGGLIGEPGKNSGVRVVKSDNPMQTAKDLFDMITADATSIGDFVNKYGETIGTVAYFDDGSRIDIRFTSKSGSPACDINITHFEGIASQKIHFERKD